ncbi:MAG: sugar phosphate nucleotidyltransferase [Dehalococcoidia bacterium]|nr:sugar phosphate nucleotidyltransferase [Dehalococcoidia bacterium]
MVDWEEKPANPRSPFVSMGIYCINKDVLVEQLQADADMGEASSHDFGRDIIPRIFQSHRVFGSGPGLLAQRGHGVLLVGAYGPAGAEPGTEPPPGGPAAAHAGTDPGARDLRSQRFGPAVIGVTGVRRVRLGVAVGNLAGRDHRGRRGSAVDFSAERHQGRHRGR